MNNGITNVIISLILALVAMLIITFAGFMFNKWLRDNGDKTQNTISAMPSQSVLMSEPAVLGAIAAGIFAMLIQKGVFIIKDGISPNAGKRAGRWRSVGQMLAIHSRSLTRKRFD